MSLKYEPASEPLHIYVEWLSLAGRRARSWARCGTGRRTASSRPARTAGGRSTSGHTRTAIGPRTAGPRGLRLSLALYGTFESAGNQVLTQAERAPAPEEAIAGCCTGRSAHLQETEPEPLGSGSVSLRNAGGAAVNACLLIQHASVHANTAAMHALLQGYLAHKKPPTPLGPP